MRFGHQVVPKLASGEILIEMSPTVLLSCDRKLDMFFSQQKLSKFNPSNIA